MEEQRVRRKEREAANKALGYGKIDIDFQELLYENNLTLDDQNYYLKMENMRIYVCVRKRILFEKEFQEGQIDCVSVSNP